MRDRPTDLPCPRARLGAALALVLAGSCGDGGGPAAPEGSARALGAIVLASEAGAVTGLIPTTDCRYDDATGWHACPATTSMFDGLTRTMTVRYLDAAGTPQRALDARTVAQIVRTTITGTRTATTPQEVVRTAVDLVREETITGSPLADRTLVQNGWGAGTETGSTTTADGVVAFARVTADTTREVVTRLDDRTPSAAGGPPIAWPRAGLTIQTRRTTYTPAAGPARVELQRITNEHLGAGRARVLVVVDGETKLCMTVDSAAGTSAPCAP